MGWHDRKDGLDWEKLAGYAHRLGSQVVAKRLGYLLDFYQLGSPQALTRLQELVGPSYALLDPILPAEGRFLSRWRLQINIADEILKGITST
jgi:predicted transcriptional regulator of viral defense system